MQAAFRTELAKGEVGLTQRKRAPVLQHFSQRFIDFVQTRAGTKPQTIAFYANRLARLLEYKPLANARLDQIDEALIEAYIQHRRQIISISTMNMELQTLRRLLRLAQEWKVIDRVPKVSLLSDGRTRDFILSEDQEEEYLAAAPKALKDAAVLMLETGLRVGEALGLQWPDIHLNPLNGAKFGYLEIRKGKSKAARRKLPLTDRVRAMLLRLPRVNIWLFTNQRMDGPFLINTLEMQHRETRKASGLPVDFVLHSLRHTFGTRLGEEGVDVFTLMRIMGHSSVEMTKRYVHPTPEIVTRAFERLEARSRRLQEVSTVSTTPVLAAETLSSSD
ncbi:MAG: site-specific integrase [Acidobacteria bacterium]|nr:site-specific integrase [Acidobacteriota bacterium]